MSTATETNIPATVHLHAVRRRVFGHDVYIKSTIEGHTALADARSVASILASGDDMERDAIAPHVSDVQDGLREHGTVCIKHLRDAGTMSDRQMKALQRSALLRERMKLKRAQDVMRKAGA